MGPSIWQLLIVLVIVLLLFGTKRMRTLGSDLGAAIRGFRSAVNEGDKDNARSSGEIENDVGDTIDAEFTSSKKEKS
ncbi:MAG: twin-arginine translocase TatA/TatE family subunit [Gammaproteobacteria bacterium]